MSMGAWFTKMIMNMVISFVLKQLMKFKDGIDFKKVTADIDAKVRDVVPGTWFDDEAVAFVHTIMGPLEAALSDSGKQAELLTLLSQEKWSDACDLLKGYALEHFSLADASAKEMMSDHFC